MENNSKGKQTAHLMQWELRANNNLTGIVSGHPKLRDGKFIWTSTIVKLDEEGRKCETLNTLYTLGEPFEGVGV